MSLFSIAALISFTFIEHSINTVASFINLTKSLSDISELFGDVKLILFEFTKELTVEDFIPKLKPRASGKYATAIPTSFPFLFIIGPPLLPGLIAASNWKFA